MLKDAQPDLMPGSNMNPGLDAGPVQLSGVTVRCWARILWKFGATEGAPEATKMGPLRPPKGPLSYQWSPEHVLGPSERLKWPSEQQLPRGT